MRIFHKKAATLLAISLSLISFKNFAQEKNPLINSGEIIEKANKLHDDKKYKESIDLLRQINRSDTNYYNALYEISYSYYADKKYDDALIFGRKGMQLFPQKYSLYSNVVASALDDQEKPKEAMAYYDTSLKQNPQSYLIYFNKGITSYNLNDNDAAKQNQQQCLLINPFYSSAHFFLGSAYLREGNLVATMMALKTYLLISPEGKYNTSAVKIINNISKGSDDVLEYVKSKKSGKTDNFDFLQEILLSKAALDPKYKLKADLEDNIVRQIQVVDEQLEYDSNDNGFAKQYYVPFYQKVFREGDFEPMIFLMFSGLEIKNVDTWNKKHKKASDAFVTKASEYFLQIKNTRILDPQARENASINYLYSNSRLLGRGAYNNPKDMSPIGKWDLFYDNGIIKATGNFSAEGKKDGLWISYYENGSLKEKMNFRNGDQEGISEGWFENGNKWYEETYRNGELQGKQTINFYNSKSRSILNFKDGKKNGEQKYYNIKGEMTYSVPFADDLEEGVGKTYFADGKIKDELLYSKGKSTGTYKSYYQSGTINTTGDFVDGKRNGTWITNYEDGALKEKTTYNAGDITGEYTEYYQNGKLSQKGNYYKKKLDGKTETYDDDGKILSDAVYEKGRLREINFYDKSGKIISTTTTRKGAATITFFNADGIKASEGYFTKEGNKDGKFTDFYASGKVRQESNWKDGVQDGIQIGYYANGMKSTETAFVDGEENGYQKEYFANGKLRSEGWVIEGKKQQTHIYYNAVGDVVSKLYYLNDDQDGYSEYYYPHGTMDYEYKYSNGWIDHVAQFDTTGKLLVKSDFGKGKGKLIFKHFNGKNLVEGNYDDYLLDGPYNSYFFDGSLAYSYVYKSDNKQGDYKSYYYGGAIGSEGKYRNGEKDGLWKYYFGNGKLKEEELYKDGELHGTMKTYYPDGTVEKIFSYKNGSLDGTYDMFDDKSMLAVRLNFKNGYIKSYQYEGADGKIGAPIELKGGTGKVLAKFRNGNPSAELNYLENYPHGERKQFYSNGKPYSTGFRELGASDKTNKVFYSNGNIWKEETYVFGNLQGICKYYYPNGKLEKEENLYCNDLHGTSKYYDEQGKLKQTRTYYYGFLTSVK